MVSSTAQGVQPEACHCLADLDQGLRALMRGDQREAEDLIARVRLCIHETPCVRALQAEMTLERMEETFHLDVRNPRVRDGSNRIEALRRKSREN